MAWVKLDDSYPDHPKIIGLSDAAYRLHGRAICYANRHLTDGILPDAFWNGYSAFRDELVTAGLLDKRGSLWRLHDYEDYQPSRSEVLGARKKDLERKKHKKENGVWPEAKRTPPGIPPESAQTPGGFQSAPSPSPVRKKKEGNERSAPFAPPSVQEIQEECRQRAYTFDPETFWAYYQSKKWKVGSSPMSDWKAACITWQKRREKESAEKKPSSGVSIDEWNKP